MEEGGMHEPQKRWMDAGCIFVTVYFHAGNLKQLNFDYFFSETRYIKVVQSPTQHQIESVFYLPTVRIYGDLQHDKGSVGTSNEDTSRYE